MEKYFLNLNETIKEYFKILSDEIPNFLYDYINTPEMQRIGKIGCACGTDYTADKVKEKVKYALFVTFEVAPEENLEVYEKVKNQIRNTIRINN